MPLRERPLTAQELAEFDACAKQGLQLLASPDNDPQTLGPEELVAAIDTYVEHCRNKASGGFFSRLFARKPNTTGLSLALGAVWGNQLARRFGWSWVCLQDNQATLYGVVSADRAWVIYPTYFLKFCLENPAMDCTAALSFNMLAAGTLPSLPAGSLENLLNGVQRIVPKA